MHLNLMPLHLQNPHTMNPHLSQDMEHPPQDTEHPKLDMVPLPNSNVQVVNLISPMVQITPTNMPPIILPIPLLAMVPPMPPITQSPTMTLTTMDIPKVFAVLTSLVIPIFPHPNSPVLQPPFNLECMLISTLDVRFIVFAMMVAVAHKETPFCAPMEPFSTKNILNVIIFTMWTAQHKQDTGTLI